MGLRSENFSEFESLCSEISSVIKRYSKSARSNYQIEKILKGLQALLPTLRRILNYNCDNFFFMEKCALTAGAINFLFNRLKSGVLKQELLDLYNRFCALVPADFQLPLFFAHPDFGWEELSSCRQDLILFCVRRFLCLLDNWVVKSFSSIFPGFSGIQLLLPRIVNWV